MIWDAETRAREAKDRLTRWCDWCDSPDSAGQNEDYGHALIWDDAPGDTIREDDIRVLLAHIDRLEARIGELVIQKPTDFSTDDNRPAALSPSPEEG